MDMKKILQALDGASPKKPVEGSNDIKKFMNIVEGKGPFNKLTTSETIAINHYSETKPITNPVLNVDKDAKPSMIGKYFKKVEEEFADSQERYKDRARQLANIVTKKINEGGITLPNPDGSLPPGAFTADDQVKLNQRMSDAAKPPKGVNFGRTVEKAASGAPGRWMISADDASAALDWLDKNPNYKPSAAQAPSSNATIPGAALPKAEKADKQAGTITVDGQDYKMVMLEPGGIRPRGGTKIAIPQAVMGERGIGNYIGILAGRIVHILPKGEQESIKEVGGNYGHHSNFNRHVSQSKTPPENIMKMAKKGAKVDSKRRYQFEETEGVDSVTMDIPLLIRLMEFAREDADDDMVLHKIAERLIGMGEEGQILSMSDYDDIVGKVEEAHGNSKIYDKCWTGYKKVPGKKRGEPGSCEKK